MIAKATFLSTIGERTIETMQNQSPKDKVLEKDYGWKMEIKMVESKMGRYME